jgi:serpin B
VNRYQLIALALSLLGITAVPFGLAQDGPKTPVKGDVKTLVGGNNEFALDLYARMSQKPGNVVFSPYSISTALAMTYGGARGDTAERMARALHFPLAPERLHPAFGELTADLQKEDKNRPYHLHVANALWPDRGLTLRPEFRELIQGNYGAGLKQLDYSEATEEARLTINRWVEEKTREKIKDLLLPGDVTALTRLVLTNAIYFKATWKHPFSKDQTREAKFDVGATKQVVVPMMHHPDAEFNYFAGDGFQWLELPYQGDRLSMVVLLPEKKGELAALEKTMTAAALAKGIAKLQLSRGRVSLPRFKTTFRLSLLDDLKAMGMPRGPFAAIASGEQLMITDVIHKAFIDVDEVGTEAAAATAVILGEKGGRPFEFNADHPFLFLIRDAQTGSILFLGRVNNPRGAE